jgi:hypothetical protein
LLAQGYALNPEFLHFETLTMEIFTKAWKAAFFRHTSRSFVVTPKTSNDRGGFSALLQLKWVLMITFLLIFGVVGQLAGVLPRLPGFAIWMVPLLGIVEIRRMLRTMVLVSGRRQERFTYRVVCSLPCHLEVMGPKHGEGAGTLVDVSVVGAGIVLSSAVNLDQGDMLAVVIDCDGDVIRFVGELRLMEGKRLGIAIKELTEMNKYKMIQYTYASALRARLIDGRRGDALVTAETTFRGYGRSPDTRETEPKGATG